MSDESLDIAVQSGSEPTNKVAAASNASGGIAGVVAGVMAVYGADALREILGPLATTHPAATTLIVLTVTSTAAFYATQLGGRAAAFNVLDKPNVPLVKAT